MRSTLVFDCEAAAIDDAAVYLEPVQAPANFVKQEAIDRYVEKATAEALKRCALDPDLARIIAIGVQCGDDAPLVQIATTEREERDALEWFWSLVVPYPSPLLIGYNCLSYDLPLIYRRCLYLNVKAPPVQMGKYRHADVEDLMMRLSFDGAIKFRGLDFYAKRLGIAVDDPHTGKDMDELVAAGSWKSIEAHCRADIVRTVALARRLGVLQPAAVPA